jgi:threonyl-tRNA synthetase
MNALKVILPDGTEKEYPAHYSALDVAKEIGARLANAVVAAEVNGVIVDAFRPLAEVSDNPERINLKLLTDKDPLALGVMRHSAAHVMARAIMRLYPGVGLAFGPTTGHGFYYDFDLDQKISEDDFPRIEQEMANIVKEDEPFERFYLERDEAVKFTEGLKQELKTEHIRTGLKEHGKLSFYRQGEFVDLCRGPHVPAAGKIKAFKILSVAGTHWKGDQTAKPLQRVYGTAWFSQKDQDQYLEQIEEAKRRDHRVIGKKLGLFQINPDVGQGLCLWLPKGATIRATLEEFIKQELVARGYLPVYSPHIGRVELYETSGHFPYYRDSQFAPIFGHDAGRIIDYCINRLSGDEAGGLEAHEEEALLEAAKIMGFDATGYKPTLSKDEKIAVLRKWEKSQERYLLKPMNCPHHVQMYKAEPRSYRDLPVRLAEFGTVYRHEQTGELNGMLRVRGLTQDDAHLFCTPEQVEAEFADTLGLVKFVLQSVGLDDYRVQLSIRDPKSDKYVGSEENWNKAEGSLRKVLTESGLSFEACEGEAAFYGPKADFMVKDAIGREWQLGTVQLDYNLPERFQLEYTGSDNKQHRPVMIHRAPFGSMERFVGMLIEHFAGAFPLWLAPEQLRICTVTDKAIEYGQELAQIFRRNGFRVSVDNRSTKINAKIRDAQLELIPYMLVVGMKEAEDRTVAIRDRVESKDIGTVSIEEALAKFKEEVANKTIRQLTKSKFAQVAETAVTADNEY